MPTFTVLRDESVIEDTVFDVDPITDTSNPFGNFAVVKMDDRGGNLFAEYQRGTRIDISVDPEDNTLTISSGETVTTDAGTTDAYSTVNNSGTYSNQGTVTAGTGTIDDRFTGYVVERRETEQSGADVLEVEAYSFDQFLRRNTVSNDQTGNTITEALADIIQTDVPVTYAAANVNIGDDQELTRSYQGEAVENVLRDLAFKSNNEDFGVNDDLEFFFRPRETVHIDRGVDNTQWFNYDIPELGKEAVNEVEVWFDDGERSVIVDDGTDKLDLQDSLDLPSPGTQRAELNRPLITNINDAEDIGRKYLSFRNATLSGTVTTYGLYDAKPGDTIDITIDSRGIDAEFVIASTEYRWGVDQTILTIVEKRGDVDDILTELNDSVQRQEMETANRDAPKNRITTTNATAEISIELVADVEGPNVLEVDSGETFAVDSGQVETFDTVANAGTVSNQASLNAEDSPVTATTDGDRLTNDGRRAIRDAWTGDNPPDITTLAYGTDSGGLSRSNTALNNRTDSDPVTQSLPDAWTVQFDVDSGNNAVSELGLETASGTLITRLVFDEPVDFAGDITITLTVNNDNSVSRGVLTNNGQTAVRDVLADNTPALPDAYAYGSDDTPVSETDTALGNQLVEVSLDEILLQSVTTTAEFEELVGTVLDGEAARINNDRLELLQSGFTRDAEVEDSGQNPAFINDTNASNGQGAILGSADPQSYNYQFTTEYTIPAADFEVAIRFRTADQDPPDLRWLLDGEQISTYSPSRTSYSWTEDIINTEGTQPGSDIEPGSHTLTVEVINQNTDAFYLDVVDPYDTKYTYTFDNTLDSNDSLSGPEHYPSLFPVSFQTAETRRGLTTATFDSTWTDVSNNQYVELANDGSTFTRINNSETGSVTFASSERGVDTNIGLSHYGTQTETPTTGINGQQLDSWSLLANPDATVTDGISNVLIRAVVSPNTIDGQTVREAGVKGDGNFLTRHILAEFTVLQGQRISSSETVNFVGDN